MSESISIISTAKFERQLASSLTSYGRGQVARARASERASKRERERERERESNNTPASVHRALVDRGRNDAWVLGRHLEQRSHLRRIEVRHANRAHPARSCERVSCTVSTTLDENCWCVVCTVQEACERCRHFFPPEMQCTYETTSQMGAEPSDEITNCQLQTMTVSHSQLLLDGRLQESPDSDVACVGRARMVEQNEVDL